MESESVTLSSVNVVRHFRHTTLLLALGACIVRAAAPIPPAPTPLAAAVEGRKIVVEASGNGREQLTVSLRNPSPEPITVAIPAGLIATGDSAASRVIVLRAATVAVPGRGAVDVSMPAAALSSKTAAAPQRYRLEGASEPRLAALLKTLADQPDAPRPTMQLAVLAIMEDIHFAEWRRFLGTSGEAQPTPAEVTQAIDALGLLRTAAPQQTFALGNDSELKLRALRNPWSRAKAVALYGLDSGVDPIVPDLRQLLHTQAGDNCPTCRQRALMQKPADLP
jgi:hypothetical protein